MLKKAATPRRAPAGIALTPQTVQIRERLNPSMPNVEAQASGAQAETPTVSGLQRPVEQTALEEAWNDFAHTQMADGPRRIFTTLTAERPVIEGEVIRFKIHNTIQQKDLDEIRGQLMDYLRDRLENVTLMLELQIEEAENVKVEFLSEREKYDRLAAKNPLLEELRKRLDLDLR